MDKGIGMVMEVKIPGVEMSLIIRKSNSFSNMLLHEICLANVI
jgi:hypothetical protein